MTTTSHKKLKEKKELKSENKSFQIRKNSSFFIQLQDATLNTNHHKKMQDVKKSIMERIIAAKGQFVSVSWKSEVKPAAAHKSLKLEKITKGVCRSGIDFSNLSSVQQAIEDGKREAVQALPWGEWKSFPHIIEHKGEEYARLYPSKNCKLETSYLLNGKEIDKKEFISYLTPSTAAKMTSGEMPDCLTVKVKNLIEG